MSKGPRFGKKLVGVALVVAALVAAAAGGMVLRPKLMPGHKAASATAEKGKGDKSKAAAEEQPKDGEEKTGEPAVIVDLGEFLVNLEGGTVARYLRAEVSVRLSGLAEGGKKGEGKAADVKLPAGELALARDRIVTVLSRGVFEQLKKTDGREKLKEQMLKLLQEALPEYEVHEVLFTAFVMQ